MTRRWIAAIIAVALTLTVFPQAGAQADDGTAVTVSGTGEFADLKVTVGQTTNLINQVVTVSWTGGKPTVDTSVFLNYLQIMQCWGDVKTGPDRTQCQYGALFTDTRGGVWTGTRQVSYGGNFGKVKDENGVDKDWTDPNEPIKPAAGENAFVPFSSVTGGTVTAGNGGEFFDAGTTNEIPYGRTLANGTGQEFFEVQTGTEAPGLGCGEELTDGTARPCFLVIVPRGETEINGSTGDKRPHNWLDSSPLEATNWANKIVVPLQFQTIGKACPIGTAERRTVGAEAMTEAMLRWQPTLCAGTSATVYGYSQVTDDMARTRLTGTDPGMVFVNSPAAPSTTAPQVYAPVAVSGLAIALNIEWQSGFDATDEDRLREGRRLSDLKLTPRLIAKLLTQSYRSGADITRTTVRNNPQTISADPEFKALNPDYAKQLDLPIGDILVPLGQSDLATRLWLWILADSEARAFLTGSPDPWGMKVNPVYSSQSWPQDNFPKSDLYCIPLRADDQQEHDWCTLDMHPYANNMHDAARYAARGDTLVRNATSRDAVGAVIGWKKGTPQAPGKRAVLAVTDVATADRYGLPMAQLRNHTGAFVAPTTAGLVAGVTTMTQSATVPNVLEPSMTSPNAAAYPLTTVLYAGTVPSAITAEAGADYADLLRYAAAGGQTPGVQPGTLPYGYAPLPEALRALTVRAATQIEDAAGKAVTPAATPTTPPVGGGSGTGVPAPAKTTAAAVPNTGSQPSLAAPAVTPSGHGSPVPVAQTNPTPGHPVGNLRYALIIALAVGLVAALAGPIFLLRAGRARRTGR
ncbi:hypothetical protein BJ973_007385 [Actinoplanes tereljensis]|uniref:PBP domain-containing protein n=1 Tax=Paractinoplanes tereljensis TaxID=571912 RepID=A0A919TWH2_9ACTN|nr:hypothetical protein [Actinoplanes tereljensis]GIF25131.1 hypothetical protein Ate02nite_78610 [Actinoplanes tereljensis]